MATWSVSNTIDDTEIDEDSALTQALTRKFRDRDVDTYSANINGNVAAMLALLNSGHSHSDAGPVGTTGQGVQIPAAGIATGGIHKTEYVQDNSISHARISTSPGSRLKGEDFANQQITGEKWEATAGNGLGSSIFSGGPFYPFPETLSDPVSVNVVTGYGKLGVLQRLHWSFEVTDIQDNSVRVAYAGNGHVDAGNWRYSFRLI